MFSPAYYRHLCQQRLQRVGYVVASTKWQNMNDQMFWPNAEKTKSKEAESVIVEMTKQDYDTVRSWMKEEDWNPGKFDKEMYFYSSKDKIFYFVLKRDNKLISAIMIRVYNENFASLGGYITVKEERGKGYGKCLWDAAVAMVEREFPGITICLFAVPAQVKNYQKSSFSLSGWNTNRWQKKITLFQSGQSQSDSVQVKSVAFRDVWTKICACDAEIASTPRSDLLYALINKVHRSKFYLIRSRNGDVLAFAGIRPCESGSRIGPMYSKEVKYAKKLLEGVLRCMAATTQKPSSSSTSFREVFFDSSDQNKGSRLLAEYFGFNYHDGGDCVAMHTGKKESRGGHPEREVALGALEVSL